MLGIKLHLLLLCIRCFVGDICISVIGFEVEKVLFLPLGWSLVV